MKKCALYKHTRFCLVNNQKNKQPGCDLGKSKQFAKPSSLKNVSALLQFVNSFIKNDFITKRSKLIFEKEKGIFS